MTFEPKQWITVLLIVGAACAGWNGYAARSEHALLDAQLANLAQVREELARQANAPKAASAASAAGAAATATNETAKPQAQQQHAAPPADAPPAAPAVMPPEVDGVLPEPKSRAICFVVSGESVPRPTIGGMLAAREPPRLLLSWPDGKSDWLAEGESARGWELMHLNLREAELIHECAHEALRWRAP